MKLNSIFFCKNTVQRIPRYNLLLADLVKHTWPDHKDYATLKQALGSMEEVANYINERKREAENLDKIWELEKKTGIEVTCCNFNSELSIFCFCLI